MVIVSSQGFQRALNWGLKGALIREGITEIKKLEVLIVNIEIKGS